LGNASSLIRKNTSVEQVILGLNMLNCIFSINLKHSDKGHMNLVAEKEGLLDTIEELQNHQDPRVRSAAYRVLFDNFEIDN